MDSTAATTTQRRPERPEGQMTTKHRHTAASSIDRPYQYPVGPVAKRDERAHGGVARHDTCSCGATRITNINGRWTERGTWTIESR